MKSIIFRFILSCASIIQFFIVNAQQPYFISHITGLQVLDVSNNPIRKDKNYSPTPVLNEEFLNPGLPPLPASFPFNYGYNLFKEELSYVVLEDAAEDNFSNSCNNNNNFFTTNFTYPISHIYQSINNVSTVKLIMQKYAPNFIQGWYKKGESVPCGPWEKTLKKFTYTKGELFSNTAYKYGYFEARFKVNRPAGTSNTGIGHCFWLFPIGPPNDPNYVSQVCHSEIDIAENYPDQGIQNSRVIATIIDNKEKCDKSNSNYSVTNYCNCRECLIGSNIEKDIYSPNVEQSEFHTYACEWTPSSIKFFYDNKLNSTINNFGPIKTPVNLDPMTIIFDIEAAQGNLNTHRRCQDVVDGVSQFPFEFEIDYVRLYKMDLSSCNQVLPIITSQLSFNSFANNPEVRKTITISNDLALSPKIRVSGFQNIYLRAADYIEISEGFEVDETSEFLADVIGGCDAGY